VSQENTIMPCSPLQQNPIFDSRQSGILCANYIHGRVPAQQAGDDFTLEIFIGQERNHTG
jgi:hypothetical protein